eukprot:CAMPEP_0201150512 /NCGR_PEP_ID=MMETSP0851-20130426/11645_1 /ASSEMBLY_ACC=CAM_ASM_000631 /TAXON_ID=183588 /ORGANISM="Pseudo-nitzschia fraudulenta, Strain WWA7" /LENGTH=658 /DNA_ID=CAMNT_0047427197 /DNA_START=470 /DNA_END=2446 /DNA_ORIENTATION=-
MPFPYVYDGDRPVPDSELPPWMLSQRTRVLTETEIASGDRKSKDNGGCVLYWMQRDARTVDNWGLLLAQHLAHAKKLPLRVVHVLAAPHPCDDESETNDDKENGDKPPPLESMPTTERHGKFLLGGLRCVHDELREKHVPLDIVHYSGSKNNPRDEANNPHVLEGFLEEHNPALVVCDTNVLRQARRWNESPALRETLDAIGVPLYQVDAHNVVPVWYASPKREVGARTLRSKLHKVAEECLQNNDYKSGSVPEFTGNKFPGATSEELGEFDYESHKAFLNWDDSVKSVLKEEPGTTGGIQKFEEFTSSGLRSFSMLRNDPNNEDVCSGLSPWFNHGHLSFATCMRGLRKHNRDAEGKASFVEEGFVRRELSDNFLWYAPDAYDTIEAGAQWAQDSLELHSYDPREYIYTLDEFESGKTHDDLWNAAQLQVVRTGKMHGFLRMYWAKKILEWTSSPSDALGYAQYLNDKYALDGRDPNGFCGVAWSIFGNHDMGWKEREIFGKIRFMNYNGCKRKFKVDQFVKKHRPAAKNAAKAASDATVASRTKQRNKIAAANFAALPEESSSEDDSEPSPKRRKTTAAPKRSKKQKIQKTTTVASAEGTANGVEDLSGLTKSAASKKKVKVLKAYLLSRGVSIKDNNGKNLLKAGLIEALMSTSS